MSKNLLATITIILSIVTILAACFNFISNQSTIIVLSVAVLVLALGTLSGKK
ncbi:MAG: hypothetical protein PHG35_01030 [Dehalococcoidales bacterium]|nr:hypothetical protein [Dehalococcoidales bacterium]